MRIVSLACSNTEIVWALGRADWLVGVDDHSDFPEDVVERLARVGPDLHIDIDAVAELEPDLVLASLTVPGHEEVVEGLRQAGLPHIAPAPTSVADVYRDIRDIGRRLDAEARAEAVVAEMEEALRAAGARNPLRAEAVKSRPLTDEEVLEMAPDAIVVAWCGVHPSKYRPDLIYDRELWKDLPAVRNRQVHCVPEAYLGRPGPRLVEGVRALREIVEGLEG